jgi:hypothetical protein
MQSSVEAAIAGYLTAVLESGSRTAACPRAATLASVPARNCHAMRAGQPVAPKIDA